MAGQPAVELFLDLLHEANGYKCKHGDVETMPPSLSIWDVFYYYCWNRIRRKIELHFQSHCVFKIFEGGGIEKQISVTFLGCVHAHVPIFSQEYF